MSSASTAERQAFPVFVSFVQKDSTPAVETTDFEVDDRYEELKYLIGSVDTEDTDLLSLTEVLTHVFAADQVADWRKANRLLIPQASVDSATLEWHKFRIEDTFLLKGSIDPEPHSVYWDLLKSWLGTISDSPKSKRAGFVEHISSIQDEELSDNKTATARLFQWHNIWGHVKDTLSNPPAVYPTDDGALVVEILIDRNRITTVLREQYAHVMCDVEGKVADKIFERDTYSVEEIGAFIVTQLMKSKAIL